MTPNAIGILIHCHCTPMPHPRAHTPAVMEEIQSLLVSGLIEEASDQPGSYTTTERGAAHVRQLCELAWPKKAWVNERGEIIEPGF